MTKDKKNNKVTLFFKALAEWQNIPLKFAWKAKLVKKIGHQLEINHSNLIGTWEGREYIPDDAIDIILKLDIPESLKTLCKNCEKPPKTPPEKPSPRPGSTFGPKGIVIQGHEFRKKEIIMDCVDLLWNIEQIDPDIFAHAKKYLEDLLDCAGVMSKKINRRSSG